MGWYPNCMLQFKDGKIPFTSTKEFLDGLLIVHYHNAWAMLRANITPQTMNYRRGFRKKFPMIMNEFNLVYFYQKNGILIDFKLSMNWVPNCLELKC